MKQMTIYVMYLCFFILCPQYTPVIEAQSSSIDVTTLRIGSMDLPPYGWKDAQGEKHGIVYEMNQEIGIRSGLPITTGCVNLG